ncbi:hypothetical protein HPB49_011217 [Dermacentor silvarum]|uniref:Uncharacterized protein n=1 Tax=Dermacentor silvarum TaxID=543639 RepID=A0ACB8CKY4_DERSI|nr:hypothetical protein HPB49_011217 [Dermacentor silvarum]
MRHIEGDSELPSVSTTTMHRMLKKLGFRYKKWSRNALLIVATRIVQSRSRYLHHILVLRRQDTLHKARRSGLSTGLQNLNGKGGRLIVTNCDN